jgi:glycosyltransferase involved in cell wall biosynthesis
MKIAYFNYLYDTTEASVGAAVHVKEFAAAMKTLGHDVKVYHLNLWHQGAANGAPSAWQRVRNKLKSRLRRYVGQINQILANVRYASKERTILREEKPDALLIRYNMLNFSAPLIAQRMGIPVVLEVNSPMAFERKNLVKDMMSLPVLPQLIERLNLKLADAIIVVSKHLKDYFVRHGVPAAKITVIPNGVDIERFSPKISGARVRAKYGLGERIVLGFVGSFHYWHGLENLLKLIEHTIDQRKKIAYLLVGDGPLKKSVDDFVTQKKLEQFVILPGYAPHQEIPEHVAAMDIVLAPYPKMDFFYFSPLKIFEYMAAGKPVIASRIGQIAEIIHDEESGILYAPENVDELMNKTASLIENTEDRQRLGDAARRTIVENYTWQHNAGMISRIIASVLSAKSGCHTVTEIREDHAPSEQVIL